MSETLIAVIVTGAVSIIASSLSPVLAAVAQWQLSRRSRRDETSSELLTLGSEALEAVREAIAEAEKVGALLATNAETMRRVGQEGGGIDAFQVKVDAADRALTKLELRSSGDVAGVAGALRSAIRRTSTDAYLMSTSLRFEAPGIVNPAIIVRDLRVVDNAATALKLMLQPYTATVAPSRRERRVRREREVALHAAVLKGLRRPSEVIQEDDEGRGPTGVLFGQGA